MTLFFLLGSPCSTLAYDGLSDFLGEVFRGLTGQKKQAVPIAIEAVQQFPPPAEAELEKRKDRLVSYATAAKHWLATQCRECGHPFSEEQLEQLDQLFLEEVETSQDLYKQGKNRRNQHGFSDYAPVKFTIDGAASSLFSGTTWTRKIEKILTPEQIEAMQQAEAERRNFQLAAKRAWILSLLDQELYFTADQRKAVAQHLEKRLNERNRSQLYSLTNQNYYLQYQQPHSLLKTMPNDVLSEAQHTRLERVSNGNVNGPASERYITFMSNDGVDSWYEALDKAIDEQGKRLRGMADLQIEYFQNEYDLDQASIDHLALAAKGASLYRLSDWKKGTKQNLREWEERMQQQQFGNGNFGFSVSVPAANCIEEHQLWRNAVKSLAVDTTEISSDRNTRRRQAEAQYLLSLIDEELWLTQRQREKLTLLLREKMPKSQIQGYEYMYEIVLLSIPMVVLNEKDVKKICMESEPVESQKNDDPAQMHAFKGLKGQYKINGRNVMMQMQNMGQFSFNIPQ